MLKVPAVETGLVLLSFTVGRVQARHSWSVVHNEEMYSVENS